MHQSTVRCLRILWQRFVIHKSARQRLSCDKKGRCGNTHVFQYCLKGTTSNQVFQISVEPNCVCLNITINLKKYIYIIKIKMYVTFVFLSFIYLKKRGGKIDEQIQTMEREDVVRRLAWKTYWCEVQHCFRTSMPLGGSPERWRHHRGNRWLACPQWKNGWVAHFQTRRRLKQLPNVKLSRVG